MNEKVIFLVTFNMYKGGSLAIYEKIKKFIYLKDNLIEITFNKKFHFNFNSKVELIYPIRIFNVFYRVFIEQILLLIFALIKKPKKIILLGNFPCLLWRGEQKVLFHNLLYIKALKKPKSFGIKLFCESKFWEISIKALKPKIIVQTKFVEETLKKFFNFDLDIEVLGAPILENQALFKFSKNNSPEQKVKSYPHIKIDKNFIHLLYPAALYAHKNHNFLFQCSDIFSKNKMKVHLTIDEKSLDNLENKETFIFHKNLSKQNLNYLYENINALIYTSLIESLGMPLLEITQYQKSVIAINLPYVSSAIKDFYVFDQNKCSFENTLNKFKDDFLIEKNKIAKTIINIDSNKFFEQLID